MVLYSKIWQVVTGSIAVAALVAPPVLAQNAQNIEIIGVQITSTEKGLALLLEAIGNQSPQLSYSQDDRTIVITVQNARLLLPEGNSFRQENPADGFSEVTMTTLDEQTVQIRVTAIADLPSTDATDPNLSPVQVAFELTPDESEDLVVIGTRRPVPRTQTTASIEVVPQAQLQRELPLTRSVNDTLQTVPGVTVNRLGLVTANINIRGLTGERIGALVDGDRLPNRQFGPPLGNIDPFRIERVELLKGPASSIYGADAFGGVVNIITTTPRPDRPFQVRTNVYGGNIAELGGNVEFLGPNFVVGTSLRTAGDTSDGNGVRIPLGTAYQVFDLYASGRVDLSEVDRLELRFDRYRQNDTNLAGFATPANSPFQNTAARNVFQNRDRYSLVYVREGKPDETSITVRTFYQRFEDQTNIDTLTTFPALTINRGPFLPPLVTPATSVVGANYSRGLTEAYGITAQATTPIGDASLTYGYDFSKDVGLSNTILSTVPLVIPGRPTTTQSFTNIPGALASRTFNGVFVQSTYNISPELTVAGGLRYDDFELSSNRNQRNDSDAVTFNLGGLYRFNSELAARVNFAQGFRPPSLLFLFGNQADGSFFAPTVGTVQSNPNLRPERANNFDVGLDYTIDNLRAGVTYFNNQISDFNGYGAITPAPVGGFGPPPVVVQTVNKSVNLQGVELSAAYGFAPNWTVEGNLTYVSSSDSSGQPLSQLEVFPLTTLLRLRYDDGTLSGYLQSRIYGGQGNVLGFNNTVTTGSPSSTVFDLSVGYRVTETTQLTLSAENLFDSQYIFPTTTIPAPGIRLIFGVRSNF